LFGLAGIWVRDIRETLIYFGSLKRERAQFPAEVALRLDNGSELTSHTFVDWAKDRGIALRFIEPGKPNQNAYIERFNRTYREEVLSAHPVRINRPSAANHRQLGLIEYDELRPHDSLGQVPPLAYLPRELPAGESSFKLST
jgi:putative transposase